jgi:hypothetical protein
MAIDKWLPRLYVLGQIAVMAVCGALIAAGKDTIITDLFIATAGGLTLTQGYRILAKSKDPE